ncbi:MAG: hypothetical protein QNJ47_20675 [Nostocaceae cyanobacterium]|nr:hypothetical protein [Nostocaceae cyanobacterium]
MQKYPSAIYSSSFRNLKKAFQRWRQGLSGFPRMKSKKFGVQFALEKVGQAWLIGYFGSHRNSFCFKPTERSQKNGQACLIGYFGSHTSEFCLFA